MLSLLKYVQKVKTIESSMAEQHSKQLKSFFPDLLHNKII